MQLFDLGNGNALKLVEPSHAKPMFELIEKNRDHLRAWLPWVDSTNAISDVENFIKSKREQFAENNGFTMSIWCEGKVAGCIELHAINWHVGSSSIGYWLGQEFEGRGLVTIATRAIVDYAFNTYGLNRIDLRAAAANRKSRAVPERLGFTLEGVLRQSVKLADGQLVDFCVYAVLASEWKQRN